MDKSLTEPGLMGLRFTRRVRWLAYGALAAVLALGLWGYQLPAVVLAWESLMVLCGF